MGFCVGIGCRTRTRTRTATAGTDPVPLGLLFWKSSSSSSSSHINLWFLHQNKLFSILQNKKHFFTPMCKQNRFYILTRSWWDANWLLGDRVVDTPPTLGLWGYDEDERQRSAALYDFRLSSDERSDQNRSSPDPPEVLAGRMNRTRTESGPQRSAGGAQRWRGRVDHWQPRFWYQDGYGPFWH